MSEPDNQEPKRDHRRVSVSIPESAYEPLQKLARLDERSLEKILSVLPEVAPGLSMKKFSERVSAQVDGVDPSDVRTIVSELFRMDLLRSQADLSIPELAEVIAEAADEVDSEEFDLSEQEIALLQDRIVKLFGSQKTMLIVSKAQDVLVDHENVFLGVRLFSDVRTIFSQDAETIDAAVLVHDLVLHYERNDEHKDFHIALDESDIPILREVLDRAEKKANALRGMLSKAEIPCLNPSE